MSIDTSKPVIVLSKLKKEDFEFECAELVETGYILENSNIQVMDTGNIFQPVFQAIFIRRWVKGENK